jgi:hypothetical protein
MNTIEKKEYIKPELEIVEIATEDGIAQVVASTEGDGF